MLTASLDSIDKEYLLASVYRKDTSMVTELILKGVDINNKALRIAAENEDISMLKLLINCGAKGESNLLLDIPIEIIEVMLENGLSYVYLNNEFINKAIVEHDDDKLILAFKYNKQLIFDEENILTAIRWSNILVIKCAVSLGLPIPITAIYQSIAQCEYEITEFLIDNKIQCCEYALLYAIKNNDELLIKRLCRNGAIVTARHVEISFKCCRIETCEYLFNILEFYDQISMIRHKRIFP